MWLSQQKKACKCPALSPPVILLVWLRDPAHLEAFWGNTALPEHRLHLVQPHHDPAAYPRVPGSDLVMSSRATKSRFNQHVLVIRLTVQAVWLYSNSEGTSGTIKRQLFGLQLLPEDCWAGLSGLEVKIQQSWGWKESLKDHLVHLPCHGKAHLSLDQIAHGTPSSPPLCFGEVRVDHV